MGLTPFKNEKASDDEVLKVTKQSSIFIGLLMDFQSPGEIEDCNKSNPEILTNENNVYI